MNVIKKVWITKFDGELVALSMESRIIEPIYMQLQVNELVFPDKPTVKYPERHTISIKLLSNEDLELLRDTINEYLKEK